MKPSIFFHAKKAFYSIAISTVLLSCESNQEAFLKENNEPIDSSLDKFYVTIEEARSVASDAFENIRDATKRVNIRSISDTISLAKKEVDNINSVKSEDGKCVYYIINYEEGGFLILSADKRTAPILAYSETGFFKTNDEFPEGLEDWMNTVKKNINDVRATDSKQTKIQNERWEAITKNNKEITTRMSYGDRIPNLKIAKAKILDMKVCWNHHGEGYNAYIDCICPNLPGNRAYVGCSPVAIGQIMKYWKYPTSYNWDDMPDTYATNTTAKFLAEVGVTAKTEYTCSKSGTIRTNIAEALRCYGYACTGYYNYIYSVVARNINLGQPVIMNGSSAEGGHSWICLGYMEYEAYYGDIEQPDGEIIFDGNEELPTLLYMNWGWGAHGHNGFYTDGNINVSDSYTNFSTTYTIDGMIVNIRPQ